MKYTVNFSHKLWLFLASALLFQADPLLAVEAQQFFKNHCIKCHGETTQEADLRLDNLHSPTSNQTSIDQWSAILTIINSGEMPPEDEPRPSKSDIKEVTTKLSHQLSLLSKPVPALRRMNRTEYENTVHDLLGIDASLSEILPEDATVQGFDNVAGGLGISSILIEKYLEAADTAFDDVIRRIKPLPAETRKSVLLENKDNISSVAKNKGGVIEKEGAYVDFTPGWPGARIDSAHPIEDGIYLCRAAVWPVDPNDHRTLTVGVFTGPLFGPGKRHFQGMYDVTGTAESPRIFEFTTFMKEGHTIHILPWIYPEHVTWRDKEEKRPGVAIAWAETYGPLDQSFPSNAQKQLFGDVDSITLKEGASYYLRHRRGVKSHFVDSSTPHEDAERIIRGFVPKAFRRPVDESLIQQFVDLTLAKLDQKNSFEDSVRAGVSAVLCSPHFLLLNQETEVDDYAIASRLSYFLWSSMPDEELLRLASQNKLSDPHVRFAQVERMLNDPKIKRLVSNFTGQWLNLRDLEETTPDKKLYPEFDDILLHSMQTETERFFSHLLKEDLSVINFIDSDFAIINQRLATHYQIPNIKGHENFRLVQLPEDSVRGGLLPQASILKVTANGTTTSPVLRGVWVLDKLLGQPASPPPPGVPAVEPDIRGAKTIRDQLDLHRENSSCNRCHARIDPPGFALEEFDVIGGQRSWYRSLGSTGEKVNKVNYRKGPEVETGGTAFNGKKFSNFVEYRKQILDQPEVIYQAISKKLLIYGSGRPVTPADQQSIDSIVKSAKANNYGLRSMIHAVVESDLFLRP